MVRTAPVSASIVTRDPNLDHLARTLNSVHSQNVPPAEVIMVDSTPGGAPIAHSAHTAYEPVMSAVDRLQADGVNVVRTSAGIGNQRRAGIESARQPYVLHLDEDAVLLNPDHTTIALDWLDEPDVSAVGGPVDPIEPGLVSNSIARMERMTGYIRCTHYLTHERALCQGGSLEQCFPNEGRGNDIFLRNHLRSHGQVVRDDRLVCLKDLPTTRQKKAMAGAAAVGAAVAFPW